MKDLCFCDSGKTYDDCCKPFHEGAYPTNALELMRSRYTAYAKQLADYIIRTTHPDNPHFQQNHHQWMQEILNFCRNTQFKKLEILNFTAGSQEAFVTFKASLIQNHTKRILIEKSHFVKVGPQWLYRDGIYLSS